MTQPWGKSVRAMALAALLGFHGPVTADDTELFVTGFDAPASCNVPNVLFLIDTSGSMDNDVETQVSWDPDTEFDGCYDSDQLYFSSTGEPPDCSSEDRFDKDDNFCAASDERLRLVGRYSNLFRGYDEDRRLWSQLEIFTRSGDEEDFEDFPVECEADRGIHGDGSNGAVFAADGIGGPWIGNNSKEPAWASASNVTIFDGNWLNWNSNPPTTTKSRLAVVQEVTKQVIDSMDTMNVAVMRFNFDEGGPVIQAMNSLENSRDDVKEVIDDLRPDGFTPLSETLYEAGQYFAGRQVDFGDVGPQVSVPLSRQGGAATGSIYNSPIQDDGQKSYIILLSDGDPTEDTSANGKITSLPGFAELVGTNCDGTGDGACLDDMAEYLFEADLRDTVPGQQNVITHTIGFTQDLAILEATAQRGGGRYFRADDTASLTQALTDLAESFEQDGGLFTAPSIPVNAFNQAEAAGDVFVSVFDATNTVRWPGNLKKYRLRTTVDGGDVTVELVDQLNRPAVDPATGFFNESARSFWSDVNDGAKTRLGGAASRLPGPDNRVVFTDVAGNDLNSAGNQLTVDNAVITATLIGAPAMERDRVIRWARGLDVLDEDEDGDTTDARLAMGDPLHSQPVTILYGGTEDSPDSTVYVGTNEGYLHAVNAQTGEELWSFVPSRLLQRLYTLYTNNESATRIYGVDGEITVTTLNNDGVPGISGAERVILLFGLRRGGDSMLAVDVTNRNQPQLLWEVTPFSAGFGSLGQTWSPAQVTTVNVGGTDRRVAIFGGGYDTGQDNRSFREDNVGNAIFMVDALTGELLWSAGRTNDHDLVLDRMRFSIPSEVRLVDFDGDGRTERMYFGDMGAQLWRIDLVNGNSAAELAEGGVLASLGAADLGPAPPASEVRRFYAPPDVVPIIEPGRVYIALNIGSGYRAHPLDTDVVDQFYSVRDGSPLEVIQTEDYPAPFTVDDLLDVTANDSPTLNPEDAGWRFDLNTGAGEKVLSPSTTFANVTFFTSFIPANVGDACVPAVGRNRIYAVSVLDATSATNLDDPLDRSRELNQGGIAPEPVIFFPEDAGPVLFVATDQPFADDDDDDDDDGDANPLQDPGLLRSFWLQRENP